MASYLYWNPCCGDKTILQLPCLSSGVVLTTCNLWWFPTDCFEKKIDLLSHMMKTCLTFSTFLQCTQRSCETNMHWYSKEDLQLICPWKIASDSIHNVKCIKPCMPWSGPRFNIKMTSYQYRKSHCGDKTILRPSYLHNGISYTGKTTSLYWIRAQCSLLLLWIHGLIHTWQYHTLSYWCVIIWYHASPGQ